MIEEHKQVYLEFFVSKTRNLVVSHKIGYNTVEDPIFKLRWVLPTLRRDLLLIKNQVPLFLLTHLLETSKLAPSISLNKLAFNFFDYSVRKPKGFWAQHHNLGAKHLLDLFRKTFIPGRSSPTPPTQCCDNMFSGLRGNNSRTKTSNTTCFGKICCLKARTRAETLPRSTSLTPLRRPPPPPPLPPRPFLGLIVSAKKLRTRGIKFQLRKNVDTPLDICFKNGLLEIPLLVFDDFISSLISNSVAFEHFNMTCTTEMTSYVTFMSCLTDREEDTLFLCAKGIIENYFGTSEEVTMFFKNIGKVIALSLCQSYLANVFDGVNKFKIHKTPWRTLSSSAAIILLLLTIAQTFFVAFDYFSPPKN
ncbi:PREDICTED: UPF0481 protein At3g47200-like [Camelina sativa]|uniref:UPF0481 protein At3g47200-like n=1 Tax=Camelina sativa TaxID=90675 RepID=A0ABM0VDE9_CAMSA|nr:PREDICTED: UPF0481 protein At3g47200-like [Camelina sativa]